MMVEIDDTEMDGPTLHGFSACPDFTVTAEGSVEILVTYSWVGNGDDDVVGRKERPNVLMEAL